METLMNKTEELHSWVESRLYDDYPKFEQKITDMISKYGSDYDKFIDGDMSKYILNFCRKWPKPAGFFLNNTYVDALCKYMFVRDMIDSRTGPIRMFEFSPFRGWSTFVMSRAILDSGRASDVLFQTCELDKQKYAVTKQNLKLARKVIAYDSVEVIRGDAIKFIKGIRDESIDLMFIDSDHGYEFTKNYVNAGSFRVTKDNAYIHIHDFVFWLKNAPDKYREPEYIVEIMQSEGLFNNYVMGQLFMLLGGTNTHENLVQVRDLKPGKGDPFTNKNYFLRNDLPKKYWLGGTIKGVNKKGIHRDKTWVSGLGMWAFPEE